jgi:nicotinate-nucleotide--dimethylbenzimidazole phosphoribosyltransferase
MSMELYTRVVEGISGPDRNAMQESRERQDSLAKPIGSFGTLEDISIKVAGITGRAKNEMGKKCIVIMAADNGVYAEGVSSCPQIVTATQTINFIKGITGIGVLARFGGSELRVIDLGIDRDISYPGVIDRKIRKGTGNIAKGPAMSRDEAVAAMEIGMETVGQLARDGYRLLGTGEMGIGNTSTSSAVLMGLTGCGADAAVGKGAGLTEEGFANKKDVIARALAVNRPDPKDPVDVLAKVGGFDIAGLAGCFLGAAYHRIPIVVDGFISALAALVAYRIEPLVREYMFPSHCSDEPGYRIIMDELGMEPILNLHMRLGEGTGCPLAFTVIEAAEAVMRDMATFEEAEIDGEAYIDIRRS